MARKKELTKEERILREEKRLRKSYKELPILFKICLGMMDKCQANHYDHATRSVVLT